jgi:hypothetical protein
MPLIRDHDHHDYRSNPQDEVGLISTTGIARSGLKQEMKYDTSALERVQRDRDQALANLRAEIEGLIQVVSPVLRLVEEEGTDDNYPMSVPSEMPTSSPLIRDFEETIRKIRAITDQVSITTSRCEL